MFGTAILLSLSPTPTIYQSSESAQLQLHLHLFILSQVTCYKVPDQAHSTLFYSTPNYLRFNSHSPVLVNPSHNLPSPKSSETSPPNSHHQPRYRSSFQFARTLVSSDWLHAR